MQRLSTCPDNTLLTMCLLKGLAHHVWAFHRIGNNSMTDSRVWELEHSEEMLEWSGGPTCALMLLSFLLDPKKGAWLFAASPIEMNGATLHMQAQRSISTPSHPDQAERCNGGLWSPVLVISGGPSDGTFIPYPVHRWYIYLFRLTPWRAVCQDRLSVTECKLWTMNMMRWVSFIYLEPDNPFLYCTIHST